MAGRPKDRTDVATSGVMHPAEALVGIFNDLRVDSLQALDAVYAEGVVFIDPAHELHGLPALKAYFARLYAGVEACSFEREGGVLGEGESALLWTMHLQHPRLAGGSPIRVPGASHLRHDSERVHYHRDHFDLGALLYEHVPLLGGATRWLKRRLGA